jgi:hypothetical protein
MAVQKPTKEVSTRPGRQVAKGHLCYMMAGGSSMPDSSAHVIQAAHTSNRKCQDACMHLLVKQDACKSALQQGGHPPAYPDEGYAFDPVGGAQVPL